MTHPAPFEALRHRHNYAVKHARILLDFRIAGHLMGDEVEVGGPPRIVVKIKNAACLQEVVVLRNGKAIRTIHPQKTRARLKFEDHAFEVSAYYYVRVTQSGQDEHGNNSRA